MLPRRHILDVWEYIKDEEELVSMATISLAIDAVKYMDVGPSRDHLLEALDFNEFICYMYPSQRPRNRSLLFHVVSDLLGLLMYGVPRKKKASIENLETIDYSEKNMDIYPVAEVWRSLKARVYRKKHGVRGIIEGFISKIRVEMAIMEEYPFVEDILLGSRDRVREWLPSLSRYYEKGGGALAAAYTKWWTPWSPKAGPDEVLEGMVQRLALQVERDFGLTVDVGAICRSVGGDREANRAENERFSRYYREGVDLLLKI